MSPGPSALGSPRAMVLTRKPTKVSRAAQKEREKAASKSHLFAKLASGAKPKGDNEDGETHEEQQAPLGVDQDETTTLGEHVASASGLVTSETEIDAEFDEESEATVAEAGARVAAGWADFTASQERTSASSTGCQERANASNTACQERANASSTGGQKSKILEPPLTSEDLKARTGADTLPTGMAPRCRKCNVEVCVLNPKVRTFAKTKEAQCPDCGNRQVGLIRAFGTSYLDDFEGLPDEESHTHSGHQCQQVSLQGRWRAT